MSVSSQPKLLQPTKPDNKIGSILQTLSDLPAGASGIVRRFSGGQNFTARLAALGFMPGTEVMVVQNYGCGPMIVAVRGARLALGRGEAGKIHIDVV